jgi:hypothetical protein
MSVDTHAKPDRDNDGDNNDDDNHVLHYGHAANAGDERALSTLVDRYYVASAAKNGAAVCAMLAPFLAESVPDTDGHSPRLRGTTCATVLSKLFALHHGAIAAKKATLKFVGFRIEGVRALTLMQFSSVHEVRQLIARKIDGRWRLLEPLDGIIE